MVKNGTNYSTVIGGDRSILKEAFPMDDELEQKKIQKPVIPCSRCEKECDNLLGHYVIDGKDVCHRCKQVGEKYSAKAR
jgi:hypothetical protein